jgi:PAS domain S-box-containing protein
MKNKNLTKEQLNLEFKRLSYKNDSLRSSIKTKNKKKTDQHNIEYSLVESEEKYKSIFHNNHSVMLLINPATGEIVDANPAAENFYGWSKDEIIKKNISEINTLTPDELKCEMENARQQKRNQFFFKHRLASGGIKDVEVFSGPIIVGDEQLLYSIIQDITDKKRNEEALYYERTLLRTIIDNIPDLIYAKDLEARKTLANKADQLLMRVKSENEALGKDDFEFYPSDRAKEFVREDKKVIETGEPSINTEGFHVDEEGKWRWLITSKYPLHDSNGKIIGLAGIGRDITDHKLREMKTERQLENAIRQQSAILKLSSNDALIKGDIYATAQIVTQTVSNVLNVDRVSIWLFNKEKTEIRCIDVYELLANKHSEGTVLQATDFPRYINCLKTGLCIDSTDAQTDPRTSEFTERYLKPQNIVSMLDAPILMDGQVIGIICNEQINERRAWEPNEIIFASEITSHVALALANEKKSKAELELRENVERQTSLIKLLQSNAGTVQEFLDLALEEAIKITNSKIGYIYHYHEDNQEFVLNSWSEEVMEECAINNKQTIYQLDKTGIWGEAVRQRKEIILNDFNANHPLKKGYPEGHVSLKRFLTIPFFQGDQIVAVVGVGNKATDYRPSDVMNLQLLMNSIWGKVISIQAEAALKESEEKYRNLVDNSMIGVFRTKIDGKMLYVNNTLASIMEYESPEEMIKASVWVQYKDISQRELFIQKIISEGVVHEIEINVVTNKGNEKVVLLNSILNSDIIDGSLMDITERKKAEEAILKSEMNLKKLNDEKDKLFSIIAHDLRSPFQGFLNLTELLTENVGHFTLDELSSYSKEMNKSARNLFKLLRNLLDWSQLQKGTLEYSPQKHLLMEMASFNIETYQQKASQKEIIIKNDTDKNISVVADERMINSIFSNLLSNAIKFTKRNGKIFIRAREIENKMVEVSVTDTGIGMPEDLINRLFKIEEKVSRPGTEGEESTSLGLVLCKEFVEKHGGKIWVESQVGAGSTFYFTLPKESSNIC